MGVKRTGLKLLAGAVALLSAGALAGPPIAAAWMDYPPLNIGENSIVYGSDGSELGVIQASGRGSSTLKSEQIPPLVKQAFLAIEDRSFLEHGGVSYPALLRAAYLSIDKGSFGAGGGGSTISQQYVKNAYLSRDQTPERYGKGMALAWKVESDYSKDDILTKYINSNYYGKGAVGPEDAAQAWFGHSVTVLKDMRNPEHVAKAAFLAALVQRPSFFDETVDGKPGEARDQALRKRQLDTIDGFRAITGLPPGDMVPAESIEPAKKFPMNIDALIKAKANKGGGSSTNLDPALLNYIKDWLAATETEALKQVDSSISDEVASKQGREQSKLLLAQGGLKIYTTIDPKLQKLMEPSVKNPNSARIARAGLAVGGVIMNTDTGAVSAMYGGGNGNNYALYAERQPGSVMKSVVLANMVKEGISVKSELPAPACIKMDKQSEPQCNSDNKPGGGAACRLSVEQAIAQSNNPVFLESISGKMAPNCATSNDPAKLVDVDGDYPIRPQSVADMARKMGADDSTVPAKTSPAKLDPVPSLALGASSLTPLKVASIGATLADGVHNKPFLITKIESAGEVAYEHTPQSNNVLNKEQTGIVNQTLTRVYTEGTARGAQVPGYQLAGKSGTTQGKAPNTQKDAWMLAWTAPDPGKKVPSYACAFWAGDPNNRDFAGVGSLDVAHICRAFFTEALKGTPKIDFPPANLDTGRRVGLNK